MAHETKIITSNPQAYSSIQFTLRKVDWHWSIIARSKPRTTFRLVVRAGERRTGHSGNRIEERTYLRSPNDVISFTSRKKTLKLTSHSPPGLTQTKASSSELPVLVVGRTPKPVPITLHQSPQAFCLVGWTPFRAGIFVSCTPNANNVSDLHVSVMK